VCPCLRSSRLLGPRFCRQDHTRTAKRQPRLWRSHSGRSCDLRDLSCCPIPALQVVRRCPPRKSRSHSYYDSSAARIAGSIRIEPNRLQEELDSLPKDKDIYVYCT